MVYIIIPARKNSKRLLGKNLLKLKRLSLLDNTINFARKINFCEKIIVTTDIKINKKKYSKNIIFIKRSKKFSGDKTKIFTVIKNILKKKNNGFLINDHSTILLFQPTSPFRSLNIIKQAYKKFLKLKKKFSVVSVSSEKNFEHNNKRLFFIKNNRLYLKKNKNYSNTNYIFNGNFYFATSKFLQKHKSFFSKKNTVPYIISDEKLKIDIDTNKDLQLARGFY